MTTTVLVSGASGFVGRAICRSLRSTTYRVIGIGMSECPNDVVVDEWRRGDLRDPDALPRLIGAGNPATLFHAAWAPSAPGGLWNAEENSQWRDISLRLFRSFYDAGGRRVIACGTCAEYGASDEPMREDGTALAPASLYGRAKVELWQAARRLAESSGGRLAWARLFYLFGPHEHPSRLAPSIIDHLLTGETAPIGPGDAIRDYGYVDDMADGLVALDRFDCDGDFNVATGTGVSIRSLAETIAEIMGRTELLKVGALPGRAGEAPRIVGDVGKISSATDWRPAHDLATGLRRTIESRAGVSAKA